MVYPTLPADADAVSIFDQGLSPYYDITWSVTYRVDGLTPGDEIGLCMFLQDATQPLSGGGVGIDLGYSGLSADSLLYPTSVGMLSAVVGIGLDSTGQFPLSVQWPDGTIRDGLNVADRVLNSASIRGSYPNYPYLSGSNTEITEFDIADSQKKTLRARLGNYGRTIYLDYKRADDDSFTNILTKDVNILFSETTRFRPGVSITKPISSNVSPSTNEIIIEAFHVEGLDENPTSSELEFTPLTIYSQNTSVPVEPPPIVVCPPSLPPLPPLPPPICPRPLIPFNKNCGEVINGSGVDLDSGLFSAVYRLSGGSGFITMSYTLSSPPLSSIDTSLSAASYEFETATGTSYGQLSVNILSAYYNDFSQWSINEGSTVKFENLDSAVDGEVLTVVGFNGYPEICTLWVDESAADGLSISASYCSEYLSAFTMVLTGDYNYTGNPLGPQIPSSSNDLYKLVTRFDKPAPIRFKLEYDEEPFYDTAYVGSEEYSYLGDYRQDFINAINTGTSVAGFNLSSDLIAGLDEALIAPDGYPWVTPALSGSNIYTKVSDSVRAKVTVYDLLSSKDWTFTLSCPESARPNPPVNGCDDFLPGPVYKFSEKGEGLFTRETITLNQTGGPGIATLTIDPVTAPDRFIVVYDNQTVIDTGYVSYGTQTIYGAFFSVSYWTNYMGTNTVINNFKQIWANQSYYDLIDRFNITFAPCGQELQQSPRFNLTPADGSPVIGVSPPFVQLVNDINPDSLTFTTVPSANTVDVFVVSPITTTGWSFNLSLSSSQCAYTCNPNLTALSASSGSGPIYLYGSATGGYYSGTYDLFKTATLVWNGLAWIYNSGDGTYIDKAISTLRCAPTSVDAGPPGVGPPGDDPPPPPCVCSDRYNNGEAGNGVQNYRTVMIVGEEPPFIDAWDLDTYDFMLEFDICRVRTIEFRLDSTWENNEVAEVILTPIDAPGAPEERFELNEVNDTHTFILDECEYNVEIVFDSDEPVDMSEPSASIEITSVTRF